MTTSRNPSIDAFRLVCAYGVVFVHLAPCETYGDWVGRSFNILTVPFFIVTGLFFFIGKTHSALQTPGPLLPRLHFERLWVPYLSWTLLYLAMRLVKSRLQQTEMAFEWPQLLLYGGAGVQLYFLPLMLLCQGWVLGILLLRKRRHLLLAGVVLLVALAYACIGSVKNYDQFEEAVPRSLLYVLAAWLLHHVHASRRAVRANAWIGAVVSLAAVAAAGLDVIPSWLAWVAGPLAGYAISSAVLALPSIRSSSPLVLWALSSSYGIYLMHHGLIECLEVVMARSGFPLTPYDFYVKSLLVAPLVCLACIGLIGALRQSQHLRFFLLGEASPTRPR
ncbi:hypothetical protein GCM10023213_38750 [Prosthecobacter algae]|uniref:Acyltransferase 3 domain-containing protein n=1 Tax=Prosthecobacter algae TaxID=1144682 RepID=A0ABP9PL70_9BACT